MTNQRTLPALSPKISAVLSSLDVQLESELNRYRRNRRLTPVSAERDPFEDLDIPAIDLDAVEMLARQNIGSVASPPPVPVNRKLQPEAVDQTQFREAAAVGDGGVIAGQLALRPPTPPDAQPAHASGITASPIVMPNTDIDDSSLPTSNAITSGLSATLSADEPPSGYLSTSEELIESLSEVPALPDPVDVHRKPKRKTTSLLAGASLGLLGLIAGLGASYVMSNPALTQRISNTFRRQSANQTVAEVSNEFDPPGPDLSANEFIDLEIDNLSSLRMPQGTIDPNTIPETPPVSPAEQTTLPPITPDSPLPAPAPATDTQAVVIPAGLTYYVTVPYTSDQDLLTIRETIGEAFVRQFSEGTRIQIAAFDNPQAAQNFIEELRTSNITAQITGPTTE